MPPLPSPGNVLKLNVNWAIDGDSMGQTVHFFKYTGSAANPADLSSFAASAVAQGDSQFGTLCGNTVGMLAATVRDLASSMGLEVNAGTPWVGTAGTALLAPGSAMVVSHSIGRHYRGGHPRTYLPIGVSGDVATTGLWTTGFTATADTAWGNWVLSIAESAYGALNVGQICNVSYFGPPNRMITGSTGRVRTVSTMRAVPIVDDITGHVARRVIGSQRRRNRDA